VAKPPPIDPDKRQIKAGRAILAAVGLRRVLTPGPIEITKDDFRRAVALEQDLRSVVYRFVAGEQEPVPLPGYDHEEAARLLSRTLDAQAVEDDLAQFKDQPGGDDFIAAASMAAEYLRGRIPRRVVVRFAGEKELPIARADLFRWRRSLESTGNPLWAVKQLLSATLGADHVAALAEVWPDVMAVVKRAVEEAKADRLEKDPAFAFTRRQARQLAALLGHDPETPAEVVAEMQAGFVAEAKDRQRAEDARAAQQAAADTQTPTQRLAAK
jgi:hypothetical protein